MWILIALLLIQFGISTTLSALNLAHLKRSAQDVPPEWAERLDLTQFPRMIAYSTARMRLGLASHLAGLAVTLLILLSGLLPALTRWAAALSIGPIWQGLLVLAIPAAIAYVSDLPWDLVAQFGVERRFGFSTITLKTWLLDQVKSLLLALVLGLILGSGMLWLVSQLGTWWWLPAWVLFTLFQLLMTVIAPVLILPLFNKFEPLQDETLREGILGLADKAAFPVSGVFQMDASLRSTHSNAYFFGLGKTRRIALYDTLIEQHTHEEILSVLAHEIGHWVKRHVVKTMVASVILSGIGMAVVARLLDLPWLYETIGAADSYASIGVAGPVAAVGLYVVGILLSPVSLILSPLTNGYSRHNEYEADAYSLELYPHPSALEEGLIRLSEKNLSNLFPHPLVVFFEYSHPPLLQRVAAIRRRTGKQ